MADLGGAKAICRGRILDAAADLFIEQGYKCSVEDIAARANVARQTLYNHFPSKEALFVSAIESRRRTIAVSLDGRCGSLREALIEFGTVWRTVVLSADEIGLLKAITAEAAQFPELACRYVEEGISRVVEDLGEFLRKTDESSGRAQRDFRFAAELFVGMLSGLDDIRCLLGCSDGVNSQDAKVSKTVDAFLRWYLC